MESSEPQEPAALRGAAFWKMQHELRKQQLEEKEKEKVKKEWEEKKAKMAFLETDPFADSSPRNARVLTRLRSLTDLKSIKSIKRVKSETDVSRAKVQRRRSSNSGDWHYPPNVRAEGTPQRQLMFGRRVFSFGSKGRLRSPPPSPSPLPPSSTKQQASLYSPSGGNAMLLSVRRMKLSTLLPGGAKAQAYPAGTLQNPVTEFKGGDAWKKLNVDQPELWIDLFWPNTANNSDEEDMLSIEELSPLCEFRNLRVLKLTGMMQSYQKYIWQAVWLNHDLETLVLEMALEPRIEDHMMENWKWIKGDWAPQAKTIDHWDEYGDGNGSLLEDLGEGEYFDNRAIEKAKLRAGAIGATVWQLTIVNLTLRGFVVDAFPFHLWFDPERLSKITFNDCVDAGFCLPKTMTGRVTLEVPKVAPKSAERAKTGVFVNLKEQLKLVQLKGGKKVAERLYHSKDNNNTKGKKPVYDAGEAGNNGDGGDKGEDADDKKKQKKKKKRMSMFGKK